MKYRKREVRKIRRAMKTLRRLLAYRRPAGEWMRKSILQNLSTLQQDIDIVVEK